MSEAITAFRGKYGWMSNFHSAPVTYDGDLYANVEAAFQAAKTLSKPHRLVIRKAISPGLAKQLGKRVPMRQDWAQIRVSVMLDLVRQKFANHAYLQRLLIATNDAEIMEGNTWNDTFWGCVRVEGEWCGQNQLGKILMQVRSELVAAQSSLQKAA